MHLCRILSRFPPQSDSHPTRLRLMDYNLAWKGSCECEKCEIADIGEATTESYDSELEEGETREEDEPPGSIHKDTAASAIELSSSAQEAVEKEQVHIRQSASPQRASHEGGTASIVVLQQSKYSVIHKDTAASAIELSSSALEAIEKEQVDVRQSTSPARGLHQGGTASTIVVQQSKCSAIHRDMVASPKELSTSAQGVVEEELSTSPESGSHQGGTASTAVVQQSKYTASEGLHVNARHSTLHRTCCGKHRRSYSPCIYSSSKERHKKRKRVCFRYSDYQWVLKKIEEVCSERFNNLLLRQIGDREKFKIVGKEHELEFFQEHVHSYRVHYAHVMPTIRYCRRKLPKLHLNILLERFHKHMQHQLIKFVKQQINDRNMENRMKERWIFEAKAGYLKRCFYVISLSYSEFKLEKLQWHMTDYSDGEEHLKYFDMQSLTTQIEAIASNREPASTFAGNVSEPILENSPSLLETNGATKLGFSVGVAEEMFTLASRSSQSTCASTMKFGEKDGTQIALSAAAAAQNEGGKMEKPEASQSVTSAKAVTAGKASDVSEPILENSPLLLESNGATKVGFSVGLAEEMATLESSSPYTCAPAMEFGEKHGTQIAFSAAAQNEGWNMEKPGASRSVTNAALELAMTTDSEHAPSVSKEKRRHISSGNDISEGPCSTSSCSRSQMKFDGNDGTQIAFSAATQNVGGNMDRPCASWSVTSAALELAMTVNNDSENTPPISKEKRGRITSGNDISEGSCSRSRKKFPYESTSNLHRTASRHEEPPPLVNIHQTTQAKDTSRKEVPSGKKSSFAQVTEQPNMHSNTRSVTNQRHCGSTCQAASHPYQPPGGNTHSVRTGVDSLGASNVHPTSANQVPIGSTAGQFLTEDGVQPDPLTIELSRLQVLHDLIAKRHKEKREQLILAHQIELAQAKRKYDELWYNSEVEVLQRKRDLKITCDKIYKQQILAEVFQVIFKASSSVVPDSPRGATQRNMVEPNGSSDQHIFQLPASISALTSAAMYQSPHLSAQASADASLRQHSMTTQQTATDSSGRPTTTLMHNPNGGMGNRHAPRHRFSVNSLPASVLRRVTSLEE